MTPTITPCPTVPMAATRGSSTRWIHTILLGSFFATRVTAAYPYISLSDPHSMQQAQIIEAGQRAEAEIRGTPADRGNEKNQQMQAKARDPSSSFPEAPLDSPQQLQQVADNQGPAGGHQGMQSGDQMAIKPPVAGKRGQQDMRGDTVGGINKAVGDFVGSVGDTEAGRKGAGGVDFSNAAGMGGL